MTGTSARTTLLPSVVVVLVVAAAGLLPTAAGATTSGDHDAVKVLLVSIDALDPAELDELDGNGSPIAPTLVSLRQQGTWWTQARGVMASETLPNHVAMATGTYPGTNGIPGNEGRLAPGDDTLAEPDLGVPEAREGMSLMAAIESQCPDLRTVTSLSKEYVWRTFQGEGDAVFPQPQFNIPESGHAPDSTTVPYILQQENEAPIDFLFANLGDHDRAGHIDTTGAVVDGPMSVTDGPKLLQRAALVQVDTWIDALVAQLQSNGEWERTVLLVVSDHSMNFTTSGDPQWNIDVGATLEQVEVDNGREPASTFLFSPNGGAGFVYLIDPDDPDRATLLEQAHDAIAAMDGVEDTLYRLPNGFDPGGRVLATLHPDWNLHQTDRTGDIVVLAQEHYRMGSVQETPTPGNHGHTSTRHSTALVTGGWHGIVAGQFVEASDPDAVDEADDTAALPEQAEQVDWAPTVGWLLGLEDPGTVAGGAPQWEGRVLDEAFARRPGTLPCGGAGAAPTGDGTDAAGDDQDPAGELAATGAGSALVGVLLLGVGLTVRRGRSAGAPLGSH